MFIDKYAVVGFLQLKGVRGMHTQLLVKLSCSPLGNDYIDVHIISFRTQHGIGIILDL